MLNANDTQIQNDTIAAIAEFNKIMKAKGYKHKTTKASASFETRYTKEGSDRYIVISGWHGNGVYGNVKTLLNLYDCSHTSYCDMKHIVRHANHSVEDFVQLGIKAKLHKEGIDIMRAYIKAF